MLFKLSPEASSNYISRTHSSAVERWLPVKTLESSKGHPFKSGWVHLFIANPIFGYNLLTAACLYCRLAQPKQTLIHEGYL